MFLPSQKISILLFIAGLAISVGTFGAVSSGASEPPPLTGISAVSSIGASLEKPVISPDADKKFAVVIGIVYDNSELGVIKYADQDATSVYNMLTQKMGFLPRNVILLRNQDATNSKIRTALEWLNDKTAANPGADVVFYYSGHGLRNIPGAELGNPNLPEYALVPVDFKSYDYKNGEGLLFDTYLAAALSRIDPGRMWITIDSCFSGGYNRPGITGPNRVVTLSSRFDELSGEIDASQRGVWTQLLIEQGVARGLSVEQAYNDAVPPAALTYGQNPQIADNYPGALEFSASPTGN